MSAERDAAIEAGARALYEERRDKSAPSDHWPDFDDIGNGGKVFFLGLAAAAYDAALPMFVGPQGVGLALTRGSSVFMDGTGDYHLRRTGKPGIIATLVLPFDVAEELTAALDTLPGATS